MKGTMIGRIKGDSRILDYGSYGLWGLLTYLLSTHDPSTITITIFIITMILCLLLLFLFFIITISMNAITMIVITINIVTVMTIA